MVRDMRLGVRITSDDRGAMLDHRMNRESARRARLDCRSSRGRLAALAGGLLGAVCLSVTPAGVSGGYAMGTALVARR